MQTTGFASLINYSCPMMGVAARLNNCDKVQGLFAASLLHFLVFILIFVLTAVFVVVHCFTSCYI